MTTFCESIKKKEFEMKHEALAGGSIIGIPFMVRYLPDRWQAGLTTNRRCDGYGSSNPFVLRYRRANVSFCDMIRLVVVTILSIVFLSTLCFAGEKPELKDLKDKESYSLGYQFGQNMKAQGVELNLEVYTSGIQDGLRGAGPLLSQEEIQKTVSEVQKRVITAHQKELKEKADKSRSEAKVFMEENKKKEGIKILPSGLQYKILAEGSGKMPKATDEVTVNYKGSLVDDTEFDSSYKREAPTTFRLDKVIRGWTEALQLMKEGSKWQLFIPPELGYGERGAGPVPPNSVLIFEVELVSVK
jgi:FKBP-type peptidyl-prolyl cis-trans isomerase FklB